MMRVCLFCCLSLLAIGSTALVQDFAPPTPLKPTPEDMATIQARHAKLKVKINELRRGTIRLRDPFLADIEVYDKAVEWTLRHGEFYHTDSVQWVLKALDDGLVRCDQASRADYAWYEPTGAPIIRAYRSTIDLSVQPYAVTLPANYGKNMKKYPMHIVLHGRGNALTEVSFMQDRTTQKVKKDLDHVILEVYGRGNNAYRWAGEIDIQEATESFLAVERLLGRGQLIDTSKVVLRGFSMGGAGTWHLGLHKPDRFCVLGPGAGFTTTRGYWSDLPKPLPDYVEKCLRIYDAVDYAENVANVPVVAYSGAEDPQKKAADNIEERLNQAAKELKDLPLKITHLIAPGLKHDFPTEWKQKAEKEYAKHVKEGRPEYPERVRFVTYTMRYHICDWVEILGLEEHYQKAIVDAQWVNNEKAYKIKTQNVRMLHIGLKPGEAAEKLTVEIDKQTGKDALKDVVAFRTPAGEGHLYFMKEKDNWKAVFPLKIATDQARRVQKKYALHGPIDDAFTSPFLCVRGTGKPWNQAVHDHAMKSLDRFEAEWDRWMRGKLPIKDDVEVETADVAGKHLILFGDPGSNNWIAEAIDRLPLTWTKQTVTLAGIEGGAANHVPVLIYPSPWNTDRYVVLNSGHTFHEEDYKGTNARLFPRLGDYALLELTGGKDDPLAMKPVQAGLFDDFWRVKK